MVVYCMLVAIMVRMAHLDKQVYLGILDQMVYQALVEGTEEMVGMVGLVGPGLTENVVSMLLKLVM